MTNFLQRWCSVATIGLLIAASGAAWAGEAKQAGLTYPINHLKAMVLFRLMDAQEHETLVEKGFGGGMTVQMYNVQLKVVPVNGGPEQSLIVADERGGPTVARIKNTKLGGLAEIVTESRGDNVFVKSFTQYPTRDGEDRPDVFLYVGNKVAQAGSDESHLVNLYKWGQFADVHLPTVRDSSGKNAPDPKLIEALGKVNPGQMVQVQVELTTADQPPILKMIEALPSPQTGVLAKVTEQEVTGGKTPALILTISGVTKTILVPGKITGKKWTPDAELARALKALQAGDKVTVRVRTDGEVSWLCEITKATDATPAK